MAVTFIANALAAGNPTTSFTITLPATQAGDVICLDFTHRGTADGTFGGTFSGTFAKKHEQAYAAAAFSGLTYWARCTGDHSGETIDVAGLTNASAGVATIYRGAKASGDPLAAAVIVGEENASGNETQAQITTLVNGAWVVLVVANSPDVAVTSPACTSPGALGIRAEKLSTGGTDASIMHASAEKATAGATGAFTWAQTNGASGSWAYAIEPAPAVTNQDATGALSAQAAAVAGAATVGRTSSGALAAAAAAVAGAGTVGRTSSGALAAQAAAIAGAATINRTASGALAAQAATISGDATVEEQPENFEATGALEAQAATISGSATINRAASGALAAQAATIEAEAETDAAAAPPPVPDSPAYRPILMPADEDEDETSLKFRAVADRAFFALAKIAELEAGTEGQADNPSDLYSSDLDPDPELFGRR